MLEFILKSDYLKRLDNIKQWSEIDTFKEESVSQHSNKVAAFARIALEDVFDGNHGNYKVVKFKLDVTTGALFHDWDESLLLRDLSHDTKYNPHNGKELRKVLDDLSSHLAEKEFGESGLRNDDSSRMLIDCVSPEKDLVHLFVKYCDWLAIIFFVNREISLGNTGFVPRLRYAQESIENCASVLVEELSLEFKDLNINTNKLLFDYGKPR